ncbi:MAG: RNA polymerase sigma factor [Bryobacteraceae bacterium]|nr:RNA polymerase sigma factor [Bryobacteraceae bacterium]
MTWTSRQSQAVTSLDDPALLDRVQHGDEAALTYIYRRLERPLYRFAFAMTGSPAMAEEAVQETFLRLIRQPGGLDPTKGSIEGYLYGIVRNVTRQALRGQFVALDEEYDPPAAGELDDPAVSLDRAQANQLLSAAILALPAHYREVVVLCDLEEWSYEAAAATVGCPLGTVRSRLNRARGMLRDRLKEAGCAKSDG